MPDPDDVQALASRWLAKAGDDLDTSRLVLAVPKEVGPWVAAFHAQQAIEKAMKAILVLRQTPFPRSHDLEELRGLLPAELDLPDPDELAPLTAYAADARYPELAFDTAPTAEDALDATGIAERVVAMARRIVEVEGAVSDG